MPAKRRAPPAASAAAAPKATKARASKLAKENGISAEEESEIKEAYQLFAEEHEDYEDEVLGVMPIADVRRALVALGLPPTNPSEMNSILSTLDPESEGYTTYSSFLAVCALKLQSRTSSTIAAEIEAAFRLFTRTGERSEVDAADSRITVAHLRRIARELKEDVSEELLRDMIREANGGQSVQSGVGLEEFQDVMSRAGVF